MLVSRIACFLAVSAMLTAGARAAELGASIGDFALPSQFGKEYKLKDFADRDVIVVAFFGTQCPLAKLYAPRLAELAESYEGKSVAFLGVDSNQQDSIQEIASYGQRHGLQFPLLKDAGNKVADQFGAERTPEVFVLDRDRKVRYHGRIDDQYGFDDGVGYQRPEATRRDLAEAVDELLAGKGVTVPETSVLGCVIGRVREPKADAEVTYSNQIARIFQNHCVECHRPGRIGPFEMTSYDEVAGWGEMIGEVVREGRMPPWHANPAHGSFANDLRLSDEDKKLIATWVADGCPEGNPSDLPEPKQYTEGWAIGEPDQIVYMSDEPIDVPAEGVIDYYHFVVDPGWTEDKWIMAAEAKPESYETVHHILVFVEPPGGGGFGFGGGRRSRGERGGDRPERRERSKENARAEGNGRRGGDVRGEASGLTGGNLIAGYAPGMNPMFDTDGKTAMLAKAGSKLIFQLHYTPTGTPAKDRSFIGFKFADPEKVEYVARSTAAVNAFFAIPAGASDYTVTADGTFEHDTLLANFTPHMHTRGKSFKYEVTYPDGAKEVLLDVPSYDFNWQTTYHLKEPKLVPAGTKLVCTASWDNSEDNLNNPDPTKMVTWGDQTFEEMMIGFYVEVFPKDKVPPEASGARAFSKLDPGKIIEALDHNHDGKLQKEEMPDRLAERMNLADLNGDGGVSKEELEMLLKIFSGGGRRN